MSTAFQITPSPIPRPPRAAYLAMNGPRPTKSSLLRASHKQAGSQPDEGKGTPAEPRASAKEIIARADELLAKMAAKRREKMVVQQTKTESPSGIPVPRSRAIGQTGISGSGRVTGHSGASGSKALSSIPSSTVAASSIPLPSSSSGLGSRSYRRLQQEVGASRTYRKPAQVHWGVSRPPIVYILKAGERPEWRTSVPSEVELWEGEIGWQEWRETQVAAQRDFNANMQELEELVEDDPAFGLARRVAWLNERRQMEPAETYDIEDKLAEYGFSLFKASMAIFLEDLEAEEAAMAAAEDDKWDIIIYGGNPMLEDEPAPFDIEDSNAEDSWFLDESASFSTGDIDPDTTLGLDEIFFPLGDDVSPIIDEREPRLCAALDVDFELSVPPASRAEVQRIGAEITSLVVREEQFFEVPEVLSFERKLRETGPDECLLSVQFDGKVCEVLDAPNADESLMDIDVDPVVQARLAEPDLMDECAEDVCDVLAAPGADDTWMPLDTDPEIRRWLGEPNLLDELSMWTGPGALCAAMEED